LVLPGHGNAFVEAVNKAMAETAVLRVETSMVSVYDEEDLYVAELNRCRNS
jgi:hypothetical protein